MKKSLISIVASCLNEEKNIEIWYSKIVEIFKKLPNYDYEIVISDNNSHDGTKAKLSKLAKKDKRFKVIFNQRNYGHILSPYNSLKIANGDLYIVMATDLEDPPELIKNLVEAYENGSDEIVLAIHPIRETSFLGKISRELTLCMMDLLIPGEQKQLRDFTGFWLMTKKFKDTLINFNEPYPHFRGLIIQSGFSFGKILFKKESRLSGKSNTSFLILFDLAILTVVSQSTRLLRFSTVFALVGIIFSFLLFLYYAIQKILFWDTFQAGLVPVILLILFLFSMVFLILGIISEYLNANYIRAKGNPIVTVAKKINID